jgi:hypothetical protein
MVLLDRPDPAGSLVQLTRWLRKEKVTKVKSAILLGWGLNVVLSCPVHGLMLEPARIDSKAVTWVKDKPEPAPELIRRLDGRR